MAKITAFVMILGVIMYYFAFYMIVSSSNAALITMYGRDAKTMYNSSGYADFNNPFMDQSVCEGESDLDYNCVGLCLVTDAFYLDCRMFKTPAECMRWSNCNWTNTSYFWLLSTAACLGIVQDNGYNNVNMTFYGFPKSTRAGFENFTTFSSTVDFCDYESTPDTLDNDKILCEQFGCSFMNFSKDMSTQEASSYTAGKYTYHAISDMIVFQYDFGFGRYNFIFSFILIWLPFIILLVGVAMMLPGM